MQSLRALAFVFALGAFLLSSRAAEASWILTISDGTVPGTVSFTGGTNPPSSLEFASQGPAVSPDSKYLYITAITDGQTATQAGLSEISIDVTNLTGTGITITTTLTENDFTLPLTAGSLVNVASSISSTSPTGGSGTFVTMFNATAMPTQSFTIPDTGSVENETFTRGASYSITQTTTTPVGAGQTLQTTGTDTVTAVPEPSTFTFGCLAIACVAPLTLLKRRFFASRLS
jgi:hypothetical protein